jgi:hypothetical protein
MFHLFPQASFRLAVPITIGILARDQDTFLPAEESFVSAPGGKRGAGIGSSGRTTFFNYKLCKAAMPAQ